MSHIPIVSAVSARRTSFRLHLLLVAILLLSAHSVQAAYSLTTGELTGSDGDVVELDPSKDSGGRTFLEFRSRNVSGSERHRITFFRFDTTGMTNLLDAASFHFWVASSQTDADAFSIDVFGVVDGVANEHDWSESSLTYDTAPGLSGSDYPDIDRDHVPGETTYLGTISYPGGGYYGELSLSSQALIDFLNADSNSGVTIFLEPQVAADGEDFFVHIRSFEGVGSDPDDLAPTLILNIEPPPPPPPPSTNEVFLVETSGDITIGNGYVQAVISKSSGMCTDLRREGENNLLVNGGRLYMDSNSGGSYYSFGGTYSLVESTTNRIHFKIAGRMGEFDADLHYVLQVGDSGFHCYVVYHHGSGDGATYLEQARMVLRCDKNVFTNAFTSEQKTGQMIDPGLLSGATEIMDATLKLPAVSSYTNATGYTDDGFPVYTKYDWADFLETHKAHGLSGDTTGLWMITGSEEFMNGGPTKGELFIHGTDSTPLMIETFHAAHFSGSASKVQLAANEVWEKVYGPYFIYVNSGESAPELWQDALQRADAEKAAWPLDWMAEASYPVDRGTVIGRLRAGDAAAGNALMVLAQPGSDWQVQGRDYIFWSRADAAGNFSIPKVRPGTYSLYAMVPGNSGEMELSGVNVVAGSATDLGRLSWTPPQRAETLWQVGTPDRSTAEFRFGDQMRQFGLWWNYLDEQGTADLNYTIGTSSPSDWYYAQMVAALDNGTYHSPKWNVVFDLDSVPATPCELVLDLAGTMSGTLYLNVNGSSIGSLALENDAGIYRSATQLSLYTQRRVSFNASLLHTGSNMLTLQLNGHSNWSGDKPVSPSAGVMYDAIRLEAGPVVAETIIQNPSPQEAYDVWAAANLPPGNHTFEGDANEDGVANGFDFAFGPLLDPFVLLDVQVFSDVPTAVLVVDPNNNGSAYTQLEVDSTRDLLDWTLESVLLQESEVDGERRWTPLTVENNLFFRANIRLLEF